MGAELGYFAYLLICCDSSTALSWWTEQPESNLQQRLKLALSGLSADLYLAQKV